MVTDTKFVSRIGHVLEAECFPTEHARLIVSCALVYLKETGKPLTSGAALIQRLRTLMDKGTLLKDDALNAGDYLDGCLAVTTPDREEIIHELAVAVRRQREGVILEKADSLYAKNGSITGIKEELQALEKLGKHVENDTVSAAGAFSMIRSLRRLSRLTTGCSELDALLQGGPARGQMAYALGGTGSGKSQFLSQIAAAAMTSKVNVLVATLEVNVGDWFARLISGLTEVPQRSISDLEMTDVAEQRYSDLVNRGDIGHVRLRDFPASVTQIEEIFAWVDEQNEALRGDTGDREASYELLVVDYLDRLGYPITFGNGYTGMGHVYEVARTSAFERKMWFWTASQSKGKDKKTGKFLDAEDSADSKNKGRITDICVTLNVAEDNSTVNIYVAKNRTGEGKRATGDLPTDFPFGRLTRPSTPSLFAPMKTLVRPTIGQDQGGFGF